MNSYKLFMLLLLMIFSIFVVTCDKDDRDMDPALVHDLLEIETTDLGQADVQHETAGRVDMRIT